MFLVTAANIGCIRSKSNNEGSNATDSETYGKQSYVNNRVCQKSFNFWIGAERENGTKLYIYNMFWHEIFEMGEQGLIFK